jgi:hypothetical protein
VALKLIYVMFSKLLGWMVLRTRSDTAKEIEILVLRLGREGCRSELADDRESMVLRAVVEPADRSRPDGLRSGAARPSHLRASVDAGSEPGSVGRISWSEPP